MSIQAEPSRRAVDRRAAVDAGIRYYVRTCTIDMQELADELWVSRATLYRVVGSRDRLLGDVLWAFGSNFFRLSHQESTCSGAERLLEVLRNFGSRMFGSEQFRSFLAQEPETAARVLFTPSGGIHDRFVKANRRLIQEIVDAGELTLRFDADSLAYVLVRLYESMWYSDLLIGRDPDPDVVEHLARALLSSEAGP